MFNWLREVLSASKRASASRRVPVDRAEARNFGGQEGYKPLPIDQLYVEPDDTEDFDPHACQDLLAAIGERGAKTVDDVMYSSVAVSLEQFFDGNRCKSSIAANVEPSPQYHTIESWCSLLKEIRATPGVADVVVQIYMIEPYEDGRLGFWPYADTIWIYSSLDRDTIASLVAPLDPDEVRDASLDDPDWDATPPFPPQKGVRPYWVWRD